MVEIEAVEDGSYAAELGLVAGDRLLTINDRDIDDIIDYYRCLEAQQLSLEIFRDGGEIWVFDVEKDPREEFGLQLKHPQPRQCGNQCQFCFVHQLPKGMRKSLYIKDEDYRFSYLYGSYITLTNLAANDLERIIREHLSPLYISVHATDHPLRKKLLGADIPEILPLISRLSGANIELHCQIVLCPGLNDGETLRRTIEDLVQFYPAVRSLAVVPVGLTKHRTRLPQLQRVTRAAATAALEIVQHYQDIFLKDNGSRFVFPADEFYLLAKQPLPDFSSYEDFFQLENGVGMIAQFRQQVDDVLAEVDNLETPQKVTLVTGLSFRDELETFARQLAAKSGVDLAVVAVDNRFFGSTVTVAGLITGGDLVAQLKPLELGAGVIIPDVMLKDQGTLLLDDLSVDDLTEQLNCPVIAVETSPWGVLDALESLGEGGVEVVHVV